jgi:hypothetical protein
VAFGEKSEMMSEHSGFGIHENVATEINYIRSLIGLLQPSYQREWVMLGTFFAQSDWMQSRGHRYGTERANPGLKLKKQKWLNGTLNGINIRIRPAMSKVNLGNKGNICTLHLDP